MTDGLHDLAPFYVLDGLDEADRARFEAHLAGCAHCRWPLSPPS
jgi:anti-sigma factor RsiW